MGIIKYLIFGFFLVGGTAFAQEKGIKEVLNRIWMLENENFDNYKTFLYFSENKIYRFELENGKLEKSEGYYLWDLYFLSDSALNSIDDKITDEELATLFNENSNLLLSDHIIEFGDQIKIINAVHLSREGGEIDQAHIWKYQFYDENGFIQYGFGWTPGQPQMGYVFDLAGNVPNEVLKQIRKISPNKIRSIKANKSLVYDSIKNKTQMYLIKDSFVEILNCEKEWLHIRTYGLKTIEGWIRKEDVE
ncbi:hypothetical protein LAG90_08635 [Marinilongibacter aquaticus]|uniref:hypothetical protein n=1 Tax=Marinilongibacter aquaticus TaxID=2975157 RepID=UPI0021BD86F2|nr:hypothetical protein [Marinilongibacter aquaticus]UBM60700.1 hypothetical protein LAG90_08635 [Marinilongibacter aquaticus]